MFQSGDSSIQNYQCGCPELITIFETLKSVPGVYGARFSGGVTVAGCIGLVDPSCHVELEFGWLQYIRSNTQVMRTNTRSIFAERRMELRISLNVDQG